MVKQKCIVILLAFAIAFNAFGNMLVYLELRAIFKATFAERLLHEGAAAQTITITAGELLAAGMRIEDGREIVHGERYYDIIASHVTNGEVQYLCLPDEAESRLAAHFISVFETGSTDAKGTQPVKNSLKNLVQEGVTPSRSHAWGLPAVPEASSRTTLAALLPAFGQVPTPPPEPC